MDATNKEIIELFEQYLILKRKSENTIKNYKSTMNIFNRFLEEKSFLNVEEQDIDEFIEDRLECISAKSVNRALGTLKTFYMFLLKKKYIKENPMLDIEDVAVEELYEPKYFTKEESKQLLKNIRNRINKCDIEERVYQIRNYALINMAINTGCRISELAALTLNEIDFDKREALIKNTKSKRDRKIGLSVSVIDAINEYLRIRDELPTGKTVFLTSRGGKLSSEVANTILNEYNNISNKQDNTFHSLRHTYATILYNNGVELQEISQLMGHSSYEITLQIYAHLERDNKKHYDVVSI